MIDINLIRQDPDIVKKNAIRRGKKELVSVVDELIKDDIVCRRYKIQAENLRQTRNDLTEEIRRLKKEGKDVKRLIKEAADVPEKIKEIEEKMSELEGKVNYSLSILPNILSEDVPDGKDSNDNKEVKNFGKKTKFDFEPKPHWELGEKLGIIDMERATKLAGAGFYVLKGKGAMLQRALVNFMIDFHVRDGYTEINPPQLVNKKTVFSSGHLPKFETEMYKTNEDFYLIPTAEVPVTSLHADETFELKELPKYYVSFTECYRTERGHHGAETRGIFRLHQFEKVEMVKFVNPSKSYDELEDMTRRAEKILELLNLPYRTILLCSGDSGFASAKTYDIEVWAGASGRYLEVSSCSNCTDFQARRMKTKFRDGTESKCVHTLNGSGLALPRLMIAIIENYQQKDGSIKIPEILIPYTGGIKEIK